MKKNLLAIVITLLFALLLVACNQEETEKNNEQNNEDLVKNDRESEKKVSERKEEETVVRDVNQLMDIILEHEGEYSDHEYDVGGKTNFGITKQSWEEKRHSLNSTKSISEIDEEDARKFYEHYWNSTAIQFSKMTPSLALVMVDTTVLMWEGSDESGGSALFFQQAVNNLKIFDVIYKEFSSKEKESCELTSDNLINGKMPEDGGWGVQTQCVFDELLIGEQRKIAEEILDLRERYHNKFADEKENQNVFKEGWQNRINSLRNIIKTMEY